MECPKCGGGAFLSEEELIKILDGTPTQILIKNVYQCRACMEKFSRLVSDSMEARRAASGVSDINSMFSATGIQPAQKKETEVVEGIKFF